MSVARIKKDFNSLSIEGKIQLIHELWGDIERTSDSLPPAPGLADELHARYEKYKRDPSRALSWDEVEAR